MTSPGKKLQSMTKARRNQHAERDTETDNSDEQGDSETGEENVYVQPQNNDPDLNDDDATASEEGEPGEPEVSNNESDRLVASDYKDAKKSRSKYDASGAEHDPTIDRGGEDEFINEPLDKPSGDKSGHKIGKLKAASHGTSKASALGNISKARPPLKRPDIIITTARGKKIGDAHYKVIEKENGEYTTLSSLNDWIDNCQDYDPPEGAMTPSASNIKQRKARRLELAKYAVPFLDLELKESLDPRDFNIANHTSNGPIIYYNLVHKKDTKLSYWSTLSNMTDHWRNFKDNFPRYSAEAKAIKCFKEEGKAIKDEVLSKEREKHQKDRTSLSKKSKSSAKKSSSSRAKKKTSFVGNKRFSPNADEGFSSSDSEEESNTSNDQKRSSSSVKKKTSSGGNKRSSPNADGGFSSSESEEESNTSNAQKRSLSGAKKKTSSRGNKRSPSDSDGELTSRDSEEESNTSNGYKSSPSRAGQVKGTHSSKTDLKSTSKDAERLRKLEDKAARLRHRKVQAQNKEAEAAAETAKMAEDLANVAAQTQEIEAGKRRLRPRNPKIPGR